MHKLIYEIKDLKGFVLGIGKLKDKILKEIDKNDFIEVSLLTNENYIDSNDKKSRKKGKTVYIKKLKKAFRKKQPDYIVCNINDVANYLKFFVKDSLYITKQKIFIYSEDNIVDLDMIIKKYKRYIDDITINKDYIIINASNYKNQIFKNIKYLIIDTLVAIYDFIGSVLAG